MVKLQIMFKMSTYCGHWKYYSNCCIQGLLNIRDWERAGIFINIMEGYFRSHILKKNWEIYNDTKKQTIRVYLTQEKLFSLVINLLINKVTIWFIKTCEDLRKGKFTYCVLRLLLTARSVLQITYHLKNIPRALKL